MNVELWRESHQVYEFGEFTLDVDERTVMRGIHRVHLAPKTFDVLVALVARASRLVSKRELLDRVWPDVFVEEGILTMHVAQLRKALGDVRRAPRYIETVSRSGYRFIATVAAQEDRRRWRVESAPVGARPQRSANLIPRRDIRPGGPTIRLSNGGSL